MELFRDRRLSDEGLRSPTISPEDGMRLTKIIVSQATGIPLMTGRGSYDRVNPTSGFRNAASSL